MSESIRRAAANEAIFREANEQIEALDRGRARVSDNMMHIVCECAAASCAETLIVPLAEYERVREHASHFFVKPGHEMPKAEDVITETAYYSVVRKRPGEGERVARQTDPRK